jgi:NagD protein
VDQENPDYVLIAFDTELDYKKMCMLCDHVRNGLPYIATHPDFNCPTETGFIPDIGATIAYVKASTGREPDLVIGKPNSGIVEETLRVTGLKKEELAMVGDRLYTDVACGVNAGIASVFVLSGEGTREDIEKYGVAPTIVLDSVKDIIGCDAE